MLAFKSASAAISMASNSVLSACKARKRCGIVTPSLLMLLSRGGQVREGGGGEAASRAWT